MNVLYTIINKTTGENIPITTKYYQTILGASNAREKYIKNNKRIISSEDIVIKKLALTDMDLDEDDLNKLEEEKKLRAQASFRTQLTYVTHGSDVYIKFINRRLAFVNNRMKCAVVLDNNQYKIIDYNTDEVLYSASRMTELKDKLYEDFIKGIIVCIDYVPHNERS